MATTVETAPVPARTTDVPLAPTLTREGRRSRAGVVRGSLVGADLGGLAVALAIGSAGHLSAAEAAAFVVVLPLWVVVAQLAGLYGADQQRIDHSTLDELVAVAVLVTVAAWLLFVAAHASGRETDTAGRLVVFWLAALVSVTAGRGLARAALRRTTALRQRALILGCDETAQLVARKLGRHKEYGVDVIGFVDDGPSDDGRLGTTADLPRLVAELGVDRVIVSFGSASTAETLETIRSLHRLGAYVDLVPRLYEAVGPSGRIHAIEGLPLIDLPPVRLSRPARLLKRTIDVAGALAGLLLTAPVFLVMPFLIRRESAGPALFRQTRLGEQMREFTVLKFRTMRVDVDESRHREFIKATMEAGAAPESNGLYKLDRPEVTRLGTFLRRTSLDELPQLINVLRGDMSLVGPRPCIPYETQFFRLHHFERFLVPAGLTGLWQVTARAHSTFGEALDMDVAYVRGWSLGLDFELLLRTVRHVLTRKGTI